eukprot:m.124810 g.124810  ORF g.124810 m.124810 type:complete len:159 (-) comp14481_c0_seq9:60-536(-)
MTVVEVVLALRKEKQCDGMSVDSDSSVQIMAVMMFSAISHQSQTETCSKKAPLFVCPHAQNGCSAHFLSCQVEYERTFDERKGKYRAENVVGGVRGDRGPPRGGGGGGGGYGGRGGPGICYEFQREGRCARDNCRFSHDDGKNKTILYNVSSWNKEWC